MKTLFLTLLFTTGLFFTSFSQSISGKITDKETNTPLKGANVYVSNIKKGTVTNDLGIYSIKHLNDSGTYTLCVSYMGYKPIKKTIHLKREYIFNFRMEKENFVKNQIVVTANKLEMSKDRVPMNISVVTEKEIKQSSETNVLPVISQYVPGLFVTEKGTSGFSLSTGSAGKVTIRGVGSGDSFPVLYLIDGQPQFMGIFGHAIPDSYTASDIEKVEVIKGPASIIYGTNAMGGVLNMITKKAKTDGLHFKGQGMAGSFSTWKLNGTLSYKKKKFSTMASWNHDYTDGDRPNSAFRMDNGFFKAKYEFNKHYSITANMNRIKFKAYDPGSIYSNDTDLYSNKSNWADITRSNYYMSFSNKSDKIEGGLRCYYMNGDHTISNGYKEDWLSTDENYGFSFYEGIKLFKGNLISLGIESKKYGGKGTPVTTAKFQDGKVTMVPSEYDNKWINITETGEYLVLQQQLIEKITINAGIRHEHHNLFGEEWIPQFGTSYRANENTTFKGCISKGYRSPSIRELYLFPPANQDLQPEEMWNYEVSCNKYLLNRSLSLEINLFLSKGSNLITLMPNNNPPPAYINVNTGDFNHKGIETTIHYNISPKIVLNTNYSYLNMNTPKIASPVHQFFLGGNYNPGKFNFALNFQYIGKLYTNLDPETTQDYLLANTKISYSINSHIQLFTHWKNILDVSYQTQYGYPMPGISAFAGIIVQI